MCWFSIFIYPTGRIRVCKIRFVSTGENHGKPCLVCKKWWVFDDFFTVLHHNKCCGYNILYRELSQNYYQIFTVLDFFRREGTSTILKVHTLIKYFGQGPSSVKWNKFKEVLHGCGHYFKLHFCSLK